MNEPPGTVVDDAGVHLHEPVSVAVDILFDGQRILSVRPDRDGKATPTGTTLGWPMALRRFLDGVCEVTVREHASERLLFQGTVAFGSGEGRVEVVDDHGDALALDKAGRLVRTFAGSAGASLDLVLDQAEELLAVLNDEGHVPAHLAYGGLLGAVRTGRMIGHDFDVDLAYLSSRTNPPDVIAESYRLERLVRRHGWATRRMSGDDFKALATMADGSTVGIDVFGSFFVDGVYNLMGEVRGELPRSVVVPLSTVELEGRTVPAPADPEALLALTYGAGWRVPDPAFKFSTPESTRRRLTGWMRGERAHLRFWERFYGASESGAGIPHEPSPFATWVAERLPAHSAVVDLGSGVGRDAAFLALQGHDVVGYDYCGAALRLARERAEEAGVAARFERLNVYESREVLTYAALQAHERRRTELYSRLLVDTLRDDARSNLWTYAKMVLRGGGRLYLEFTAAAGGAGERHRAAGAAQPPRRRVEPETIVAEIEARGGLVEHRDVARGRGGLRQDEDPAVCRLVVRWS